MTGSDEWGGALDPAGAPDLSLLSPRTRDRLLGVRALLADPITWQAPPPRVRDQVLAVARRETPWPVTARDARPGARRASWGAVLGGLLGGAAAALALVGLAVLWPTSSDVETFPLAATDENPDAVVTADIEALPAGVAITLHIRGLPGAPEGAYYAAWLEGDVGVVPVGTFHWRDGGVPIELWSGVDPASYPRLFVTLEQEGAGPAPTGVVVLEGTVDPGGGDRGGAGDG